jgi:hypothetical protein
MIGEVAPRFALFETWDSTGPFFWAFADGRVTNCWRMSIIVRQRLLLRC